MKTGVERELKFDVDQPVPLERLGGEPVESHVFSSTYHDTDDLRLLRAGLTLRRRVENGAGVWQLKLPTDGGRIEVEEAGGPAALPPSLAALLSGVVRDQPLDSIATLRTHRRGRRIDGVDVTLDTVEVLDGNAVVERFTELEAELVEGHPDALAQVGRKLRKLGARPGDGKPKLLRVVKPPRQVSSRAATTLDRLRATLRAWYDELLALDPVVRLRDDADALHDMRVTVRRLRSVLRTARPMLDKEWVRSLRDELDWLGSRLGAVRDLDVLIENLHAEAETMGNGDGARARELLRPLEPERSKAREALLASLEEERYYRLLDALEAAADAPPTRRVDLSAEKLAAKEFRRLRKRGGHLESMSDAALHKVRIQGKRARYAAEFVGRSRGKKVKRFIKAATELQDVLGDHQNAVVAEKRLRDLARVTQRKELALVAGRLIERQEQHKQRARRDLPAVWKRTKRLGTRAWR